MAHDEHLDILKKGVAYWNEWREEYPLETINLEGAELTAASLGKINLCEARLGNINLAQADLSGADLIGTDLSGANLKGADLSRANLIGANLGGADLRGANLQGADLFRADLNHTDLREANLSNANMVMAVLSHSNLTGARIFGMIRNDWRIDGVICDHIYRDEAGVEPTPWQGAPGSGQVKGPRRKMNSFDFLLNEPFRPIQAVLITLIVAEIANEKPEYELKLDSIQTGSKPHVKFTVMQEQFIPEATALIQHKYNAKRQALTGKEDQIDMAFKLLTAYPEILETLNLPMQKE